MERLTFDGNFCNIAQCRELPCRHDGECAAKRVWERLKEYENTIWTPEMLRKLNENAGKMWNFAQAVENMSIGRLKELAEADKDGRVVVLPCKIGDKLYRVFAGEIFEHRVGSMKYFAIQQRWDIETYPFCPCVESSIGKTIFLTREEAEKAKAEKAKTEKAMEGKT